MELFISDAGIDARMDPVCIGSMLGKVSPSP